MISQVNERKRKLANGTEPNDIKPKYTKSSNVDLAEDDDNEENVNSDNNEDPSEPYEREDEFITSKPFSVKRLRDRLREGDFMQNIRHFLHEANSNSNIVGQYLKAGGKPLELVQTLERIDKSDLFQISYVFNAMQLTLIEILSSSTQLTQPAIQACSYLLNSHRACIEKLLNSNYGSHKKSVLKLLTAIVALDPQFGRDILQTLNVVFNVETLEKFTKHSKYQLNSTDGTTVRTCYIHFILAYLIEGNPMLIRNLLDRNELVMAVVSGLIYDTHETATLVLSTMQQFVLKSLQVSKTKKVQVFNATVVKQLLQLYEWKGPDYYAALFLKKSKLTPDQSINPDDAKLVANAAHEFLTILLASRKYGIAFQCLGFRRWKANAIQNKILYDLKLPWINENTFDLSIKIMQACPELVRSFVKIIAPALNPTKKSTNWFEAAAYFAKLIEHLTPNIIRVGSAQMNANEMVQLLKAMCFPAEVLNELRLTSVIRNENIKIRKQTAQLLYLMFYQCNQHLIELASSNSFSPNDLRKIKFDLINHVFVMCPSITSILMSINMSLQDLTNEMLFEHLEVVLDLLLIISESIPSFITKTSSIIDYIKILGPIYELNREQDSSTRIELKAVKLILALDPKALSRNTEFFQQAITSILNVYVLGSHDEQIESKRLLRNIFKNTGLFENGPLEVDLWLVALRTIDVDAWNEIQEFFVTALITFNVTDQCEFVANETDVVLADNGINTVSTLLSNIERGVTLKGLIDIPILGQFFVHAARTTDGDESKLDFIESVAFYLFHYLPVPAGVQAILKDTKAERWTKYMQSWLTSGKPGKFTVHQIEVLPKFYAALLDQQIKFLDLFSSTDSGVLLTINGSEHEVDAILTNETQIMIFIYFTMFSVVQLNEQGNFDKDQCQHVVSYLTNLLDCLQHIASDETKTFNSGFDENTNAETSFSKALKYIFCSRFQLLNQFNVWQSNKSPMTRLVFELTKYITQKANAELQNEILQHFRSKLANQIELAIATNEEPPLSGNEKLLEILSVFALHHDHCEAILNHLAKLSIQHFVTRANERSVYADILAFLLKRLADLKSTQPLAAETVNGICSIYINIIRTIQVDINYEKIEEAIYNYLNVFYHSIGDVPADMFKVIFECKKLNKSTIKLATLLLERNHELIAVFTEHLPQNIGRKELIYPLLNVVCQRKQFTLDTSLINLLYADFKSGIFKTIEKPQKAGVIYKENLYSTLWLLEHCMPTKECLDFCQKSFKFDSAEVYQLQIIKGIHFKALSAANATAQMQIYVNFLNLFVQLLLVLLKKDNVEWDKVQSFAVIVADWLKLKNSQQLLSTAVVEKILKSQSWMQLGKQCLKLGLQRDLSETSKVVYNETNSVLLKLLALLCDNFYAKNNESTDCGNLFEMAISHSEFIELALEQPIDNKPAEIKTNLMCLLLVLSRRCSSAQLKSSHVPILLGAYNAKLSQSDRFVLAILQKYEQSGVELHQFKPFIWGESAISHYSLRETEAKTTLNQEPPMMQVMSLINRDTAESTLAQFPVWRCLNAIDQVPEIEFTFYGIAGNEHLELPSIASNRLEHLVNRKEFNAELLQVAARKESSFNEIYDPAFFVPLMSMAFAPETFTRPVRPAQNGLLAMTFAALSSKDKEMRLATGTALLRYRSHMELSKFADSQVWYHLFNVVQRGLGDLTTEMRKHKKSRVPRVPFIAGLFLARTINALVNPLHEMYRPLSNFLLYQKTYNFLSVPEFNVFFNSPDVNHIAHRQFILEVICDGIKCSSDFTILLSSHILKALFGFYNTPMSTRDTNLLILSIVNVSTKIPLSTKILIETNGLLPWLSSVIENVEFFQFDMIDGICSIVSNLWHSIQFNRTEFTGVNDIEWRIFLLLQNLCPKLSTRTNESTFGKYLNILLKVTENIGRSIGEENLDHLIKCSKAHLTLGIRDMAVVKESNEVYAESRFAYVKQLRGLGMSETKVFIDFSLRELIVRWLHQKSC